MFITVKDFAYWSIFFVIFITPSEVKAVPAKKVL